MKKHLAALAALAASAVMAHGATLTLCDFESYPIGHKFAVYNYYGDETSTTAVVEADPANSANKVLHIKNLNWNDYITFTLPEEYAGTALTDKFENVSVSLYRHAQDPCEEWKHFAVMLDKDMLYEDDGWPSYGAKATWQVKTYALSAVPEGNTSREFRLGFNSENTEYYMDNIVLQGTDYTVFEDGKLNFSNPSSTSSSYTNYSEGINIPAGTTLDVYTSRYTYWMSPIIGSGRLNIHAGGERSYIGNAKGAAHPDWSGFSGPVHIYGWPEVNPSVKAGFYGVILAHGGAKFASDNIKNSITKGAYTSLLENNAVTLHNGATIAAESNGTARAFRIASLATEEGSFIKGYYKSSTYRVYYIVGSANDDSQLAGTIAAEGTSAVGLIKEGDGTYTLTANDNHITGAVSVVGGKILVNNPIAVARSSKLTGGVGGDVVVYTGGCVGGTGNISGVADIYGHIEPGTDVPGTLTVADFTGGTAAKVKLHPTSRAIFKVAGAGNADALVIEGPLTYDRRNEVLDHSDVMPVLEIRVPEGHTLKAGDTFTLIKATGREAVNVDKWEFRVQYPKVCTWEVKESNQNGYELIATVVSTDYSGQGDKVYEDEYIHEGAGNEDYIEDYTADYDDPTPLREYADKIGKNIGVAVPVWRYSLSSTTDTKVSTIASQFNLVVAENEMKMDATEPNKGDFQLYNANQLINFAGKNEMDVRGHTLVWHQQVPSWISSNGYKNDHNYTRDQLMEIMRNHINGVAGALKGKVREWDVVNECLDDDQSVVRNNPDAYNLRGSVWKNVIGEDFIEQAFRMARAADPDAILYLNDYGVEFKGDAKAEAFFNLAKKLVEKGTPIDGVGLQCHISAGQLDAERLRANIRRYQELGLKCIITELDITQYNPNEPYAATMQAQEYCATVKAALSLPNCPSVVIWGLIDPDSWRDNAPLLFDGSVKPKEAYYGVHAALRSLAESAGIEEVTIPEAEIKYVEIYNLQGQRMPADATGLVIKRTVYTDGTITSSKEFVR